MLYLRPQLHRPLFIISILVLLFASNLVPAEARWKWSADEGFTVHLVCKDGLIASVGSDPIRTSYTIYALAEYPIRTIGAKALSLFLHSYPRYAPPDPHYNAPYNPYTGDGMWMWYYGIDIVPFTEELASGSTIYVGRENYVDLNKGAFYSVIDCEVQNQVYSHTPITWHNQETGEVKRYLVNGTEEVASGSLGYVEDSNALIVGTGDYNGDSQPDLYWHFDHEDSDITALDIIYSLDVVYEALGLLINSSIIVVGNHDYNADGWDDILAYDTSTGDVYLTYLTYQEQAFAGIPFVIDTVTDLDWQIIGSGDIDGNGADDIIWRQRITGELRSWLYDPFSDTRVETLLNVPLLPHLQVVGIADFDGDRAADLLWIDPQTNEVFMTLTNDTVHGVESQISCSLSLVHSENECSETKHFRYKSIFTTRQNLPKIQAISTYDFNSDGKADILWYYPESSTLTLNLMNGLNIIEEHDMTVPSGQGWSVVNTTDTHDTTGSNAVLPTATPTATLTPQPPRATPTRTRTPTAASTPQPPRATPTRTRTPTAISTPSPFVGASDNNANYLPLIIR